MPFDATPIPLTSPDIELLEKVYKILSKKNAWTQNTLSRDSDNHPVKPISGNAVSFCLVGAYSRAVDYDNRETHFANLLGFKNVQQMTSWNDANGRKQLGVLRRITNYKNKLRQELLEKALAHVGAETSSSYRQSE